MARRLTREHAREGAITVSGTAVALFCVPSAFAADTTAFAFYVPSAFAAETLPLPLCVPSASAAEALPFAAAPQVSLAWDSTVRRLEPDGGTASVAIPIATC